MRIAMRYRDVPLHNFEQIVESVSETEEDLHDATFGISSDPLPHFAVVSGALIHDPSSNWYIGELGFFDYYLILLAMKLKECGVFGASGYEYISYVLKNKKELERIGR
jgi:hypothetical protein